jgi:hypothetical protein
MAKLTAKSRKALPAGEFVFPRTRRYPIQDKGHARAALAYSSGTAAAPKVRAAVAARYPSIAVAKPKRSSKSRRRSI